MARFMFLMHDNPRVLAQMSPAEMQAIVERYIAWGESLRSKKQLAGGHKLRDDAGRVVRRSRGKTLFADGPYAESKEVLGGLFIVKARDYEEACSLATDCPHLDYGGTIEIRQVDGK